MALSEAVDVCLSKHHFPPTDFDVDADNVKKSAKLEWNVSAPRQNAAHGNATDAVAMAAYGICISAAEQFFGLYAISRSETGTGADYYLHSDPDERLIENAVRLEVSGTQEQSISRRVIVKIQQLKNPNLNDVGIAAVVGFKEARIVMKKAK